jgi:hypothetical protein
MSGIISQETVNGNSIKDLTGFNGKTDFDF